MIITILLSLNFVTRSQVQTDKSDFQWSIVMPKAISVDVDLKQCLIGLSKDSVVSNYIKNVGSWKFRVDSIYFRGTDASVFSIVSGNPAYIVEPQLSKYAEFRFTPIEEKVYNAEVVIITQMDTLIQKIKGEGIRSSLEVYSGILDFGEVEIGKERTIVDTVLLKNVSKNPITITNTIKMLPNTEQFEIISGGGSFTLGAFSERKLTLQFKPRYSGRTSGRIGFEYNGVGSPAEAQLFGTGIGGLVSVPSDSGYPGDKLNISMVLENIKPESIQAIASRFSALLKFQNTILTPQDLSKIQNTSNDTVSVFVEGVIANSNVLVELPVDVGLGSVVETDIEISDFTLYDQSGTKIDYDVDYRYGSFTLLGICEEGGSRLINPEKITKLMQISPNPSDGNVNIELNLVEKGNTTLKVFSVSGELIEEMMITNQSGNINIEVDTKNYGNGLYFIHLQTPAINKIEKLIIYK